ncbi:MULTISPECIES: hypothetical protein [unclassified Mesorhizobium]|uniref:hypothetical protein n=1 Tax=unclassified Mesorhizobium TaxID=325217 RepID=UPI00112ACF8F|nr:MULTISPECIES: hypothetical protein [unclassified Mesorhizobium]MBZ9982629.1 hypothetical protein [Mesorhizobium sp. BR-1-1-8]MCA0057011.1 hypothetical protein [Mesorhizobium sp. B261B1A]TPJ58711.1 hypothetical protein FJ443_25745 [Mesorhizobium sp. B2-6-1]TPK56289.1 hypothetical protein FJ550_00195 [Mesorhizobium sp. B2-5-2]TPK60284.1 hypothetical protein FJ551_22185 [Mesorhizobium sp. B2-5-1]
MRTDITPMIVPAEFPELQALVWSRDATRPIPAEEAFAIYERNWRFVDQERLTTSERLLIQNLAEKFGQGILLTTG